MSNAQLNGAIPFEPCTHAFYFSCELLGGMNSWRVMREMRMCTLRSNAVANPLWGMSSWQKVTKVSVALDSTHGCTTAVDLAHTYNVTGGCDGWMHTVGANSVRQTCSCTVDWSFIHTQLDLRY